MFVSSSFTVNVNELNGLTENVFKNVYTQREFCWQETVCMNFTSSHIRTASRTVVKINPYT